MYQLFDRIIVFKNEHPGDELSSYLTTTSFLTVLDDFVVILQK
jgi:hypothetical protein